MGHVIEVEHLKKSYGRAMAVHDVTFSVAEGEIFGLLGPNGAGKTTTVECLQGLRRADGGRVRVLGMDPAANARAVRAKVGSQLQESALPDRIRVGEALDLFASLSSSSRRLDWRALMGEWGLSEKEHAPFGSLSGGQRQRLLIALALLNSPRVVFLDEMTTGLDPAARRLTWELVRSVRQRGATVVLVTHFMDEAEALCDRVAVVNGGRVAAVGTPRELIAGCGAMTRITFTGAERDLSWLARIPIVSSVYRQGDRVQVEGRGPVVALVAAALVNRGITPEDLRVEQPTLEDAFLALTMNGQGMASSPCAR